MCSNVQHLTLLHQNVHFNNDIYLRCGIFYLISKVRNIYDVSTHFHNCYKKLDSGVWKGDQVSALITNATLILTSLSSSFLFTPIIPIIFPLPSILNLILTPPYFYISISPGFLPHFMYFYCKEIMMIM